MPESHIIWPNNRLILRTLVSLLCFIVFSCVAIYTIATKDLPGMEVFRNASRHGELFETMWRPNSGPPYHIAPVAYDEIPQSLLDAFLADNNPTYFADEELDAWEAGPPTRYLIWRLAQDISEKRRGVWHEIKFYCVYKKLTGNLDKREILCAYLNTMHLGKGVYGINAASRFYLHKNVQELSLAESALLMAISSYMFWGNRLPELELAQKSRDSILRRMLDLSMISLNEYNAARSEDIPVHNYMSLTEQAN